jgi:CHAT domain-containing protein/tetratricopeptide (TPR) repeat protein
MVSRNALALVLGGSIALAFPVQVLAQAGQDRKAEEDRVLQQCRQNLQSKQYDAALLSCKQALVTFQKLKNQGGEAKALTNLGIAHISLSQFDKAVSYLQQALPLLQQVKDRSSKVLALDNLGNAYWSLSQYGKAVSYYRQALQQTAPFFQQVTFQQVKDRNGAAEALMNLGSNYLSLSQDDKAISYYQKALSLYQQVKNRSGEALTLGRLGELYLFKLQHRKAIDYYQQALPIFVEIKDRSREATVLMGMGTAYWLLSQYGKALDHEQQALLIYRQIKDRNGEAKILVNLGTVYQSLSQYDKAIASYQQALPIFQQVKDRNGEAVVLSNLGSAHKSLSQHDRAIAYKQQALRIHQQLKDRNSEAGVLNDLGNSYKSLLQYNKAIAFYQQALSIFRQLKSHTGEAVALSNLGNTYTSLSEYDKAIASYQQALPIFRQFGNRENEAGVLNGLGFVLQQQEQPDLAIVLYKQSVNVSESIRQSIRKLPRETQEIYTSSVAGTYRRLADLLLTQGRTREAQAILELLKVQELQSYGKDQDNSPPIQFPLHSLETQALQASEKSIAAKSFSLETLLTIAQPLIQNRDRIIQESNNTPSAIGNPQAVLNAHPNALLIQNLVVGDKLWVIWTNAKGKTTAIVVPNVSQKQLTTTVEQLRKQLGSPYSDLDELKANSTKLYHWLIPPQLQTELTQNPPQHLIFSLDHVTRYIPIAVLFDGNQYLAQRYTLSNLITTASDTTDRLASPGQTPTVLALGTSKAFPPTFDALPNVPAELSAIVRDGNDKGIYPGKIRLDAAFTANSLRDNRDPFRVLHIATHGSFNPKSITDSFLLLGDGDRLPITKISSLTNLSTTHLVVLSACETGLSGSAQDGTEISGISGYFLYRGAKAVVASLWSVNDASTSLLMQQFYQNLSQGMSKSVALRQAQLSLLTQKIQPATQTGRNVVHPLTPNQPTRNDRIAPGYTHPYYWAPFILIGNGL